MSQLSQSEQQSKTFFSRSPSPTAPKLTQKMLLLPLAHLPELGGKLEQQDKRGTLDTLQEPEGL
jgi:hypothetical protein